MIGGLQAGGHGGFIPVGFLLGRGLACAGYGKRRKYRVLRIEEVDKFFRVLVLTVDYPESNCLTRNRKRELNRLLPFSRGLLSCWPKSMRSYLRSLIYIGLSQLQTAGLWLSKCNAVPRPFVTRDRPGGLA